MNSQCDGDMDSYDAMVLLTGRYGFKDAARTPGCTHHVGFGTLLHTLLKELNFIVQN